MLYLDERLLEAWVVAETCLRLASRYAESIEPQFEDVIVILHQLRYLIIPFIVS